MKINRKSIVTRHYTFFNLLSFSKRFACCNFMYMNEVSSFSHCSLAGSLENLLVLLYQYYFFPNIVRYIGGFGEAKSFGSSFAVQFSKHLLLIVKIYHCAFSRADKREINLNIT